eukprot:1195851-Prorocentrum_minimum.AAC.29
MAPIRPAAVSLCPVYTFPACSTSASSRAMPRPPALDDACGAVSTAHAAPTSMGSPSAVPVPCICSTPTWSPLMPPLLSSALRITSCWAGPLGAVSELER